MSQQLSDKFLLVDAKTAAKQSDDIKAKQDAKLKEEIAKIKAEVVMKVKIEIAGYVNRAIDEGRHGINFHVDTLDAETQSSVSGWLISLGYGADIFTDLDGGFTDVRIGW